MSVKHAETVQRYIQNHAEILAALENLQEFIADLPAPDDSGILPNLDYGHTGDLARIHTAIGEASRIADGMFR